MKTGTYTIFTSTIFSVMALPFFLSCGGNNPPGNVRSPEAVQKVLDGTWTEANAAWWGFTGDDDTDALQAAINSGARKLTIPNMGRDWVVRPIELANNQEIVLEDGVVISAKRGEFKSSGACLFTADKKENITLTGYGAALRMWKGDYHTGAYEQAEWRHTLSIRSSNNINVYGLALLGSGGDGIYVGVSGDQPYCRNVHIKDVVCDDHNRQGISVISCDSLLIEDSVFKNTWGTPPAAGIDFEPNGEEEVLTDCILRNCRFIDNEGAGICFDLGHMTRKSDISITFEDCFITSRKPENLSQNQPQWHQTRRASGISIGRLRDDGPSGFIEFKNCKIENVWGFGLYAFDKSPESAIVKFTDCVWSDVANDTESEPARLPFYMIFKGDERTRKLGGFEFANCTVHDTRDRPLLRIPNDPNAQGVYDITGTLNVDGGKAEIDIEPEQHNVQLNYHSITAK